MTGNIGLDKHVLSCIDSLRKVLDSNRFDPSTWPSGPLHIYAPNLYSDFREYDIDGCELWLKLNTTSAIAAGFKKKLDCCSSSWVKWIQRIRQSGFPTKHTLKAINDWTSQHEDLKEEWDDLMEKFEETREYLLKLRVNLENKMTVKKPTETKQDITPAKRRGIIKKITGRLFKKTSHVIGAIIVAIIGGLIVTILVDIFADFGWIERIKAVIYKILQLN